MPAKSRRNRRRMPQGRKISVVPRDYPSVPVDSDLTSRPVENNVPLAPRPKPLNPDLNYAYFRNDIKWIGIVTGIIIILLIISYIVLR